MHRSRAACASGLILAFCLPALGGASLLAQGTVPQAQPAEASRNRRVTIISADESGPENGAVPRPDLLPQRMCVTQQTSQRELRVLVANRGAVDADSFSVGLVYGYGRADTMVAMVRGIGGLAVGRSAWFSFDVKLGTSESPPATYTALVDPRYTFHYQGIDRDGNTYEGTGEVAALIPEANEHNNTMTLARTAVPACVRVMRQGATPVQVNPR
jgi:hypothetical protein